MNNYFQEERTFGGGKLQAVFSKLAAVLPPIKTGQDLTNNNNNNHNKAMSSDIIESVLADSPIPVATNWNCEPYCSILEEKGVCLTIASLTHRLELELRSAKKTHLSCGEVLLPCGLLYRVSRDILSMAESEPYGIRGCSIYLNFESVEICQRLGTIQCDPATATTFELNLTLKQLQTGWNFIPQFLKNLGRGEGTIILSSAYVLSKKKLYRSSMD